MNAPTTSTSSTPLPKDPVMIETEMSVTEAFAMQAARRELDLQEARWQRHRASDLFHGGDSWPEAEPEGEPELDD
jgi:hypothetical protein